MNNSHEIQYIPIDQLHPQNPRKDLGDLSELRDSIKASGNGTHELFLRGTEAEDNG